MSQCTPSTTGKKKKRNERKRKDHIAKKKKQKTKEVKIRRIVVPDQPGRKSL
jgi:hypothetical protein